VENTIKIGIDYSIASPGICVIANNNIHLHFLTSKSKWVGKLSQELTGHYYPEWTTDQERFDKLSNITINIISPFLDAAKEVRIEGYAFSATSSRLFQLAENTGLLKYKLWQQGIEMKLITPGANKKAACGKGNAKKDMMLAAFYEKTGILLYDILGVKETNYGSPLSDIADSYFLATFV
jgi:Holliday junction resolvasome RuvABC endonuclease subunit